MSSDVEYIEAFFSGNLPEEEQKIFDRRIQEDLEFAESVAMYLAAEEAARQESASEMKERFRNLPVTEPGPARPGIIRRLRPWLAAAAVAAALLVGWFGWLRPVAPTVLADQYIKEHWTQLPVSMAGERDSLEEAIYLYNEGNPEAALAQFESLIPDSSVSFDATKFAGIVSLCKKDYDKAIKYFTQLEALKGYYANPGAFYHAIALMERNRPGDKKAARQLLEKVVKENLAEKDDAEKLLKKW